MIDIKDYTVNGRCSNCGRCCSDILPLDTKEITKIDMYIKTAPQGIHKNHDNPNEVICPFRNEVTKKCEIYKARPYICQIFKCDTEPSKAEFVRDEIHKKRKPRSMKQLFFNDESTINIMKDYGIKIYKRGE